MLRAKLWPALLLAFAAGRVGARAQPIDPAFNPGADALVYALAAQADGQIIVGGQFKQLASQPREFIGRLRADGTLDTAFATTVSGVVETVVVQTDGKILIGGQFTTVNRQPRARIARLNADGSLDAGFNPGAGATASSSLQPDVRNIVLLADGRMLIAGGFDLFDGQPHAGLARLNANGSIDSSFAPQVSGAFNNQPTATTGVIDLALQPDGQVVICGQFTAVNEQTRNGLARVRTDGTLDPGFDPSARGQLIGTVAVLPDGRILIGNFTALRGISATGLARLNSDGSVDPSFAVSADAAIVRLFPQADGRVLLSGFFSRVGDQAHRGFARLTSVGTVDAGFNADLQIAQPDVLAPVAAVLPRADGSLIVGGNFSQLGGFARANLAEITPLPSSRLANISTRALVAPGGELVVGAVVRGGAKSLLLRGIGPMLGAFGLGGALANPKLELIPAGSAVATQTNDDWSDEGTPATIFLSVGAFPLGLGSKDSVLAANVAPGSLTARVTSAAADGSGIALAEIYDRDASASSAGRIVNLSAIGFAGTGAQALVPGFVVQGAAAKLLLVRAVGPGLAGFGVTDALADPQIAIVPQGASAAVTTNDNWNGDATIAAAARSAGAFALEPNSQDAALLVQLAPGAYTIAVAGANGTTGRVLVEVYDLDP